MNQTPLDQLLHSEPVGPDRRVCVLPDGWQQGRGLFGGLVTGLLARALEASAPGRPLRSLTAELCGPAQPGEAVLHLEVLREGNAVTTTAIRLVQGGEVQAHGVGVLGKARLTGRDGVHLAPPVRPDWRALQPLPIEPPMGPAFGRFFDFRAQAYLPFSGGAEAVAEGWVRPKNPGPTRDAAFLAACADAWWPSLFAVEASPRPMATVAFTFQPFIDFAGLDPEAPLFHRAKLVAASDGYCVELRELFGEDGRLLALNQQTFVIIK